MKAFILCSILLLSGCTYLHKIRYIGGCHDLIYQDDMITLCYKEGLVSVLIDKGNNGVIDITEERRITSLEQAKEVILKILIDKGIDIGWKELTRILNG